MRGQRTAPLSFWALLHREGGAGGAGPAGRPEDVCVAAAVPGVAGGLGKAVEASFVPRGALVLTDEVAFRVGHTPPRR